jgi:hypothetical protein
MADPNASTTPESKPNETPAAPATPAADTYAPPSKEEWQKVTAALAERNKEAAANRKAADEAKATADAAAKAKLEAEGKWKEAFEAERKEREALAAKAANADRFEGVVKAEVDALEKSLGDRAKAVAHLPLADRLPILKEFQALAAGPGAAKSSTAAPPAGHAPSINWNALAPEQAKEEFRKLTPEQRRKVAEQLGITHKSGTVF